MRHTRQELAVTAIRQLSCFSTSSSSVLLDTISQVEHHLIDLCLQRIHLSSDKTSKVAIHKRVVNSWAFQSTLRGVLGKKNEQHQTL